MRKEQGEGKQEHRRPAAPPPAKETLQPNADCSNVPSNAHFRCVHPSRPPHRAVHAHLSGPGCRGNACSCRGASVAHSGPSPASTALPPSSRSTTLPPGSFSSRTTGCHSPYSPGTSAAAAPLAAPAPANASEAGVSGARNALACSVPRPRGPKRGTEAATRSRPALPLHSGERMIGEPRASVTGVDARAVSTNSGSGSGQSKRSDAAP
mmetsp:Transcript_29370/g.94755  ORF Transcript_29370/g.94755 Transcript_29370/m.94755 type:complete len:209 (+) Transcript_29370:252-878(+)